MRRADGTYPCPNLPFDTDYIIPRPYVDDFADEVKKRKPADIDDTAPPSSDVAAIGAQTSTSAQTSQSSAMEVDSIPSTKAEDACTDKWKAAQAQDSEVKTEYYEQTGIFPVLCRHGMIIKCCEMVRSGEL